MCKSSSTALPRSTARDWPRLAEIRVSGESGGRFTFRAVWSSARSCPYTAPRATAHSPKTRQLSLLDINRIDRHVPRGRVYETSSYRSLCSRGVSDVPGRTVLEHESLVAVADFDPVTGGL